ncbi:MAG: hypothetical protein GKR96_14160 [Gammaproteobacteria bacterium]|nr:hypothetical protein [Gammaproteobacteria bacterium]
MVCLSVIPVFATSVMPTAVNRYKQQQPDLLLEVSVKNTPEIVDAVLLQQLDLGIICPTHPYEGIHVVYQTSVSYRCLVPLSHPIIKGRGKANERHKYEIDLSTLINQELITLDPHYLEQVCDEPGIIRKLKPNIRIISHSDPAIAAIASATQSIAIVDPYTAKIAASQGDMISLPIKQQLDYPIAIIARSRNTLSLAATKLAEVLVDSFEEPTPSY